MNIDVLLDLIYDIIDDLLLIDDFDAVNVILGRCVVYEKLIPDEILLGILTISFAAKSKLDNYRPLLNKAYLRNLPIHGLE